jgi:hypothetical protein
MKANNNNQFKEIIDLLKQNNNRILLMTESIQSLQATQEVNRIKLDNIEVSGFEDMNILEKRFNRLMEKHRDFLEIRKEQRIKSNTYFT